MCYFMVFSNITHCKWRESQFIMLPLPPTLFYLAQFGFVCFIFLFSSKLSSQLFRNPCDSSISPIYYSTRKRLSEPPILSQRLILFNDYPANRILFFTKSIARYNIFQWFSRYLPTCRELQIWGFRMQSG